MSEHLVIFLIAQTIAFIGVCLTAYIRMGTRVTRLEMAFTMMGTKAAKLLHSPDDHHGIDKLLDKYIDHTYELRWDEWEELLGKCEQIENDETLEKQERMLAAFLHAICCHKLKKQSPRFQYV